MKNVLLFGIWLTHILCFAQGQNTNPLLLLVSSTEEINGSGHGISIGSNIKSISLNGLWSYKFKTTFMDAEDMEEDIKNQLSCVINDNCGKDLHIDSDACSEQELEHLMLRHKAHPVSGHHMSAGKNIIFHYDKPASGLAYQFNKSLRFQFGYWNHIVHTRHIGQINLLTLNFKS